MKKVKSILALTFMIAFLQTGGVFAATEGSSQSLDIDSSAMAILMKMADFVSRAKAFSLTMVTGYDAVQENGQKIEFGDQREIVVQRPDRIREDITQREGTKAEFIFNGKQIYIYNAQDNVYSTVEKAGDIDQAIDYFTQDLQMRLPLAKLFSTDLPEFLKEHTKSVHQVGSAIIDDVKCDHVAGRSDNVDFQVWVQQGDKPFPRRIIITYKNADGEPQFWAQFRDWDLSPKTSSSLFAINPPKGAEQISFVALLQDTSKPGEKKGEQ